jgi:hypothetical protein
MRHLLLLLTLITLLIAPTAAQSSRNSDSLTDLADLIPADTTFFFAGRADAGYLETLEGLWPRLNEQLFGRNNYPSYADVFGSGTLGQILNDTAPWRGDAIALATLDHKTFAATMRNFDRGFEAGGLVLAFEVADRAAAETWLTEELDSAVAESVGRIYTVYTIPDQGMTPIVLLSDAHMIITTNTNLSNALTTGDFAALSRADSFTGATNNLALINSGYDILGYLNVGGLIHEANVLEFVTREITPYRQFRFALADFVGSMAFGGVYSEGQHLILDGAWHYGNPAGLTEFGVNPTDWITNPIDPTFFITTPQETQFFLQSTDLDGTYDLLMDSLSAFGQVAANSPELARSFGLSSANGMNIGGLIRGSITMGFAGLTGLNLENDVLALVDDTDFALTLTIVEDEDSSLGFNADAALIARHTGGADSWLPALSEAAALYGYPNITPQPVGSGKALNFGSMIDPMIVSALGQAAAEDPTFDPMLGVNERIAALGTRNAVEYALNAPTDLSTVRIAMPTAFSLFLPEPQIIGYIRGDALTSAPGWSPLIDSATFSVVASETGIIGRATITLTQPER